jgi:hypothetical protein
MSESEFMDSDDNELAPNVLASIICFTFLTIPSGMVFGYNSLDIMKLKIMIETGTAQEKTMASVLLEIVEDKHLLLSTMLGQNKNL